MVREFELTHAYVATGTLTSRSKTSNLENREAAIGGRLAVEHLGRRRGGWRRAPATLSNGENINSLVELELMELMS